MPTAKPVPAPFVPNVEPVSASNIVPQPVPTHTSIPIAEVSAPTAVPAPAPFAAPRTELRTCTTVPAAEPVPTPTAVPAAESAPAPFAALFTAPAAKLVPAHNTVPAVPSDVDFTMDTDEGDTPSATGTGPQGAAKPSKHGGKLFVMHSLCLSHFIPQLHVPMMRSLSRGLPGPSGGGPSLLPVTSLQSIQSMKNGCGGDMWTNTITDKRHMKINGSRGKKCESANSGRASLQLHLQAVLAY